MGCFFPMMFEEGVLRALFLHVLRGRIVAKRSLILTTTDAEIRLTISTKMIAGGQWQVQLCSVDLDG